MNRIRPACFILRPVRAAALISALVLISACSHSQPEVMTHTSHWAVRAPESLAIDVVGYTWTFFNNGRHIRIVGQVRNNSDQAHQSVTFELTLTDERGDVVARGQTLIFPAYLRPGGEGTFELVSLAASTGRNLPAGRLLTTARTIN
jgi:cytochrome c-type biogenesis protein CcmE